MKTFKMLKSKIQEVKLVYKLCVYKNVRWFFPVLKTILNIKALFANY